MASTTGTPAAGGSSSASEPFVFPSRYGFPAMWTIQTALLTREAQFKWWADVITRYCQHERRWRLVLADAVETPLFYNAALRYRMSVAEVRQILDWMVREEGGRRAEWIGRDGGDRAVAWIYWRRPEEWAEAIAKWVDDTGQKNTVLTLYELTNGEAAASQDFYGMDPELLQKALQVLVKRGKVQIFGSEDQQGAKFF